MSSPELSDYGRLQIGEVTETLRELEEQQGIKINKIISSPLIRCVQTSDIVAEALGIDSISLEYGIMEEAKSFRGHPPNEPAPVWTPLVLSRGELGAFSNRLNDETYQSLTIKHEEDYSCTKNGVREVHMEDSSNTDPVQVTSTRCRRVMLNLEKLFDDTDNDVDCVLVVSHYAIVKGIAAYLHKGGLEGHMKVGSIGCFRRVDQEAASESNHQPAGATAATTTDAGTSPPKSSVLLPILSPATTPEKKMWVPISTHWHSTKRVPPRPR